VDLLKLDAEGAEYEILYTTPGALFTKVREIRLEYHQGTRDGENLASLTAWLESAGYDIVRMLPTTRTTGILWVVRHD
jgi:hypothetical protein